MMKHFRVSFDDTEDNLKKNKRLTETKIADFLAENVEEGLKFKGTIEVEKLIKENN